MKQLEILKAGSFTATGGAHVHFSEADLRAIVTAYDPSILKAPLVIGHPTLDAPAYGYVKSLSFANGKLLAEPAQVDVQFSEMVNSGRYLSLSASFYTPGAPGNPRPGSYYLRHVGFLGAWPPAVKGLASPAFSDGGYGVVELSDANQIQLLKDAYHGRRDTIEFAGRMPGTIPWDITRMV